jgi:hypothetical protein
MEFGFVESVEFVGFFEFVEFGESDGVHGPWSAVRG